MFHGIIPLRARQTKKAWIPTLNSMMYCDFPSWVSVCRPGLTSTGRSGMGEAFQGGWGESKEGESTLSILGQRIEHGGDGGWTDPAWQEKKSKLPLLGSNQTKDETKMTMAPLYPVRKKWADYFKNTDFFYQLAVTRAEKWHWTEKLFIILRRAADASQRKTKGGEQGETSFIQERFHWISGVADPIPKRNLIQKYSIPPRRKFWVGDEEAKSGSLWPLVYPQGHDLKFVPRQKQLAVLWPVSGLHYI